MTQGVRRIDSFAPARLLFGQITRKLPQFASPVPLGYSVSFLSAPSPLTFRRLFPLCFVLLAAGWIAVLQVRAQESGRRNQAAAKPAVVRTRSAAPRSAPRSAAPAFRRVILSRPGGDTLARLASDDGLQVVGREGEWVRVRLEGWTRAPVVERIAVEPGQPSFGEIQAEPARHRGREVRWSAEFLSLQRAEPPRTDLAPGESFLLVRNPNGEPGFLYVAVPANLESSVRGLTPLQRFRFMARVRTGRSALTGHPVLDLVQLL